MKILTLIAKLIGAFLKVGNVVVVGDSSVNDDGYDYQHDINTVKTNKTARTVTLTDDSHD